MTRQLHQFTILISINHRLREFNFRQRTPLLYEGNTTDVRGERYYFIIEKTDNGWALVGKNIPNWLADNTKQIIETFLQSEYVHDLI